ncbi:MAG TPA: saccharopine dehydrogenase NADP-binding domain-containing protein [Ktedonobacterales bacterium]|jgi:hypothetical protein
MPNDTVLVLGGTGIFGRLVVADLLTRTSLSVVIATRHGIRTHQWLPGAEGRVSSIQVDASGEQAMRKTLEQSEAKVLVHTAGPYAHIGDAPLRAAIACRVPYVDMCPRSDLYSALRERYDRPAREAGIACLIGASTAGGLTGLLTRYAYMHMRSIEWVHSSLCVHNFEWGRGVVADYLLSARRILPSGQVGSLPERVFFPSLGIRTVYLADTLDYVDPSSQAVRDVAYRVGLPNRLPALGMRVTTAMARTGLPVWRFAGLFGKLTGLLGGAYTEGGLLHQAFGEGLQGRGTFETHIYRPYGNVRNPSLLCSLAAARLVRGELPDIGIIHPATWLAPEELIAQLRARAVVVRSRFRLEDVPFNAPWEGSRKKPEDTL